MEDENTPATPDEAPANPPVAPPATPAAPAEPSKPAAPASDNAPVNAPKQADLDAATTERDTHKTRADAAETQLRTYRVKDAFTVAANDAKTGIRNPKAVQAMLNTDKITFEKNDKGEEVTKGLSEELTRIKGEFPEFFYAVPGNANAAAGATTGNAPEKLDGNAWLHGALASR